MTLLGSELPSWLQREVKFLFSSQRNNDFQKSGWRCERAEPKVETSAPWHKSCGHSLFPSETWDGGSGAPVLLQDPFLPPVLAPVFPEASQGTVWKWGKPQLSLSLEL